MTIKVPKRLRGPSPAHNRSKAQEKEAAKRIGGYVTKGSGSGYQKGDVRRPGLVRIEAKTTKHKSFSVTTAMIEKLEDETAGAGEVPVFEIELELGRRKAYVVSEHAMDELLERLTG